ncbi:hypothetical protein [Peristeroidobacter soli]|uniref:hypothetical protein n=1 Tax=Peristeroidobacter soli TaxID=2497877 RepID=UPI00101C5770|nr:hypothetical protein [Peristeroidobacter soli]
MKRCSASIVLMATVMIAGVPQVSAEDIVPGGDVLLLGFVDNKSIVLLDDDGKRYELGKIFCLLDRNSDSIPAQLTSDGTRYRVTLRKDGREIPLYVSPANVRTQEGTCTPSAALVPMTERGGDRRLCTTASGASSVRVFKRVCP